LLAPGAPDPGQELNGQTATGLLADAAVVEPHPPWDSLFMLAEQIQRNPGTRIQLALKRLFDLACGIALVILVAPVLGLAALATRLSSSGPILFRQIRWGKGETHFWCYKFRSMYVDQDKHVDRAAVEELESKGVLMKYEKDPRVTAVGSFLRKTSIDELPQLFNVIKGDMSLVGPRPLVLHMLEPYPELRRLRCMMRPGITGLWQVSDRANNNSALQMERYDIRYVLGFSLWLDLKTLIKTPAAVIWGEGAH
jgi:lipopolysaccharide/colanic/teichoic acid biosynthesis glycosyltransferase